MLQFKVDDFVAAPLRAQPLALAVIVPTFNECDNVLPLLGKLRAALAGISYEIIFVDDNSSDGTANKIGEIAREDPTIRIIQRIGRRGLSTAVVEGMMASAAEICVVIDADLQHDETIIPSMYEKLLAGNADIVVGTRYANGGSVGEWSESRVQVSRFATVLAKIMLKTELSDPMSGFFAIRKSALVPAIQRLSGAGYKILLDIMASSSRPLTVEELPYRFSPRVAGESKLDSAVMLEYIQLLLDKTAGRIIPTKLIMFLIVGALGLGIHLIILGSLLLLGLGFETAQATAVVSAMTANFFLNNSFTYRDRRLRGWRIIKGLMSFYLVCGVGAIANVGIGSYIYHDGQTWWLAGIAGALIGSVWNFSASSILTWKVR